MGWCQVRGLLLPASLLLLAASVALAAGTPAASAVDSGSSAVAQLAAASARLLSSALVLCGRGLLHFTSAVGGESSAGLTARAMSAMRGSGRLLLSLFGSGQVQAAWHSSGLGAVLDECTNFWVRVPAARRLLRHTVPLPGHTKAVEAGTPALRLPLRPCLPSHPSTLCRTTSCAQVVACALFPHLVALPLATAAWVQLAAAALHIATSRSTCAAALDGRPLLQRHYAAAAALLQRLTSLAPPPMGVPGTAAQWASGANLDAAVGSCCAVKSFAWLACACILSLWVLHRREVASRLAWAAQQRGPVRRLALPLQGALLPRWAAAAELLMALSLAWRAAALLLDPPAAAA